MAKYVYPCCVEFEDVDQYGIAHHSKLITYLERARVHFFRDHEIPMDDGGFQLVLVDMQLQFKRPAKMMDDLQIHLGLNRLRGASLIWDYEIKKGEELILKGLVKMASVDTSMHPTRFPDAVAECLSSLVEATPSS